MPGDRSNDRPRNREGDDDEAPTTAVGENRGPSVECPDVSELVRFMSVNLVDKPDEVRVELVEERQANVYELEVAESDLGKVIGRGGKTARALRTVVQAVAPRSRKRTLVEILE